MYKIKLLVSAAVIALCSTSALAQDAASEQRAIEIYQSLYPNVSAEDAAIRVSADFLNEMRDVQSCLSDKPEFAGMYVKHEPQYKVVTRFTKKGNKTLKQCTKNKLFKAVGANASLIDLNEGADAATSALEGSYIDFGLNVDIEKNKVFVEVEKDNFALAKSLLKGEVDNKVVKIKVGDSFQAGSYASVVAGLQIQGCTAGFSVVNNVGVRGMSTAAHCGNSQAVAGSPQVFRGEILYANNTDLQWHNNPNDVYLPRVFNPFTGGATSVKGAQYSAPLVANSVIVCKLGPVTGETCGTYKGFFRWTNESGIGVFPTVDSGSGVMGARGDSGGPVYHVNSSGLIAFGAVAGGDFGSVLYYTPLEGYDQLQLRILTE